jgi:hypothetical protein
MARQQHVVSTYRHAFTVCRTHAWCYGDMLVDHVAVATLSYCPLVKEVAKVLFFRHFIGYCRAQRYGRLYAGAAYG